MVFGIYLRNFCKNCIDIFLVMEANIEEFLETVSKRNPSVDDRFLRLVNLRTGTAESDICNFFVGKKNFLN